MIAWITFIILRLHELVFDLKQIFGYIQQRTTSLIHITFFQNHSKKKYSKENIFDNKSYEPIWLNQVGESTSYQSVSQWSLKKPKKKIDQNSGLFQNHSKRKYSKETIFHGFQVIFKVLIRLQIDVCINITHTMILSQKKIITATLLSLK